MVTNGVGQVLSRGDIPAIAESIAGVAQSAGAGSPNTLGDIETILKFFERAVPLFQQASETLMRMQGFERGTQEPNYQMPGVVETLQTPTAPNPQPTPEAKQISAIKVYSAALGALNDLSKLDPDLTITAALEMARDYKQTLLPLIEEKIPELYQD